MKTILATLAAVAAVTAVAAPAAAQPYRDDHRYEQDRGDRDGRADRPYARGRGGDGINARQADIEHRIAAAARRGLLSNRELQKLRSGVYAIERQEAAFRQDGLDSRERAELNRRLDLTETSLEWRVNNQEYARR
jgi:Ni/Co efflux regulator RcnB